MIESDAESDGPSGSIRAEWTTRPHFQMTCVYEKKTPHQTHIKGPSCTTTTIPLEFNFWTLPLLINKSSSLNGQFSLCQLTGWYSMPDASHFILQAKTWMCSSSNKRDIFFHEALRSSVLRPVTLNSLPPQTELSSVYEVLTDYLPIVVDHHGLVLCLVNKRDIYI